MHYSLNPATSGTPDIAPHGRAQRLWGVIAYYNPCGHLNKMQHLLITCRRLRQQGLAICVAGLFPSDEVDVLPQSLADLVLNFRSSSVLWHKERLLNVAISCLPCTCDRVVWLDGDVLFTDDGWVHNLDSALDRYQVVQPFSTAYWLQPEVLPMAMEPLDSLAAKCERVSLGSAFTTSFLTGDYDPSGHVGFAWAARRELLSEVGLYDRGAVGGGDFIFAAAATGADTTRFLRELKNDVFAAHISLWAEKVKSMVDRRYSSIPGSVLHLWHGEPKHRKYFERYTILSDASFNPVVDLILNADGMFEWNSLRETLHEQVKRYFRSRREQ